MTERLQVFEVTLTYRVIATDAEEAYVGLTHRREIHLPIAGSVKNLSTGETKEITYD